MHTYYNVKFAVTNEGKGMTEYFSATIEFYHHPNDYGNGWGMYIKGGGEAFGGQGYDIRYDKRFSEEAPILYIVKFYSDRYDGKDGAWKLIMIRVCEAEEV